MIIKTDKEVITDYFSDASNYKGNAELVYIPENQEELRQAIEICFNDNQKMTISGAGTGLTGGRVPSEGTIISTEKLDKIIALDKINLRVIVEPGVKLIDLHQVLAENGLFYPPNPTEKNSSIGGNVATNASGARTFKYGATREFVTRLKVITTSGDILNISRAENFEINGELRFIAENGNKYLVKLPRFTIPPIKHAAGYFIKPGMDLIDLFIGSEGTLGVVSEIELKVFPVPEKVIGLIAFFDKKAGFMEFLSEIRNKSKANNLLDYRNAKDISARLIEYFDNNALNILRPKFANIPEEAISALWIEQETTPDNEDEVITAWYSLLSEHTSIADKAWAASDDKGHRQFTEFRHSLPLEIVEINIRNKQTKIATDTAVPDEHFEELFDFIENILAESGLGNVIFGHVGNSHLHANMFVHSDTDKKLAYSIYDKIIDKSLALGGTVSAEHGIGKIKREYLLRMFGKDAIEEMRDIKKVFDYLMLLNNGNLF